MKSNAKLALALALALLALGILSFYFFERNNNSTRANPVCFRGYGTWLSNSSLNDPKFSDKEGLELMYGLDSLAACSIAEDSISYHTSEGFPYFASISVTNGITYEHRVVFFANIDAIGKEKQYLVITQKISAFGFCHPCAPEIWGGVFKRVDGHWQTIIKPQFIKEFGTWGEMSNLPENTELVRIGPTKYGVILKNTYLGQGVSTTDMLLITEVNGALKVVFGAGIAGDNQGVCFHGSDPDPLFSEPCWRFDSRINFVEGHNSDFYDLEISTQGTEYDDSGPAHMKDASADQIFEFRNGEYSFNAQPR